MDGYAWKIFFCFVLILLLMQASNQLGNTTADVTPPNTTSYQLHPERLYTLHNHQVVFLGRPDLPPNEEFNHGSYKVHTNAAATANHLEVFCCFVSGSSPEQCSPEADHTVCLNTLFKAEITTLETPFLKNSPKMKMPL